MISVGYIFTISLGCILCSWCCFGIYRAPAFAEDILVGGNNVEGEGIPPPERSFWAKYVSSIFNLIENWWGVISQGCCFAGCAQGLWCLLQHKEPVSYIQATWKEILLDCFFFFLVLQWMYLIPLVLIVMNAVTQAMNMPEEQAGGQAASQVQQSTAQRAPAVRRR